MTENIYKLQFAKAVAQAFQKKYEDKYKEMGVEHIFNSEFIYNNIEKPKNPRMGRFAFPVFKLSKLLNDKPQAIATSIAAMATTIIKKKT